MNVLVIDDDARFRAYMRRLLERKFFASVAEAENGLKGLDALKQFNADIIFLDYEMPHMNGKEFLQKLREFNKIIPVAIMTAHNEKELVHDLIPFGITDYIIKAVQMNELAERLGQVFSKNRHLISKKL